ncbi:MAG: M16 family metallopeptidase, partial [Gemmatimonadales bacterium]
EPSEENPMIGFRGASRYYDPRYREGFALECQAMKIVREEMGLAYAIYSFQSFYRGSGITGVYVGTHPESADEAIETIRTELERVASQGLPQRELAGAKQQLKGQITLGLESPSARMYRLAALALYGEPYRNLDRTLSEIDAVSAEQVHEVAREFFQADRQTVVSLGPG